MQQETSQSMRGTPLKWEREAFYVRFEFLLKNSEGVLREVAISSGSAVSEVEIGEAGIN